MKLTFTDFNLPVTYGDTVYYLIGSQPPRIAKCKVVDVDIRHGVPRVIVKFEDYQFGIFISILGTRLFLTEESALDALKGWRD